MNLANHDDLTGALNRRAFLSVPKARFTAMAKNNSPFL
ncbi:hypothetical protein NBRC111894_2092 [Sporolactobacillus inulinus]|uniref:Uncharacterized protein n=1 Tax=Sporolactobacillus inulinus TaxID=2078 RepID=A0A4Y1ZD58_9BACL|nr:hypothetical protein NBRC111894_2092 [Sporolactobacillus inulinus]